MTALNGRFITIEGGEGVGKSTLIEGLRAQSASFAPQCWFTREPGGTEIAERIRRVFSKLPAGEELTAEGELFLISAARAQHVSQAIAPRIERGEWVVCDRFADSTRVYQGIVGGVADSLVEAVINASTYGLVPHLTLYVDCPTELALARLSSRQLSRDKATSPQDDEGAHRYDQAKQHVHEQLRRGFQAVAARWPDRIAVLDGRQEPAVLLAHALRLIKERT